ncbi:MAG: hypothetical protein GX418_03655 [Clostridiales bacterium]|nr:hypothetical protein [Clostridiales bacterium]
MDLSSIGWSATALAGPIIALVLALAGSVAVAVLFLRPRGKSRHKGWIKKLEAHVNFDRFLLSSILKFLYAFCALYCIVYGLIVLFSGNVVTGLLLMLLLPVGLRVAFEQVLLLLSLREEVGETNELLRRMQGLPPKNPPAAQPPQPAPAQPRAAQPADPRYAQQRPASYPPAPNAGYGGYTAQPRPAAQRPSDYGMTQRYAPVRSGYAGAGYEAPAYGNQGGVVRPTPADGTGRFSALPKADDPDSRDR